MGAEKEQESLLPGLYDSNDLGTNESKDNRKV